MSTPVLFIHGLWLHASAWQPWIDLYTKAGYRAEAPGWPGEPPTVAQARNDPAAVAGRGIDDVVEHYAKVIAGLDAKPVLVGHSFGGLIAQRLLGENLAAAAVAIDAAQIKGVLPLPLSALRATFPVFRNPTNRGRAVSLNAAQFRFAFGNALSEHASADLYERWTIPSPGKPLFEAAAANFSPRSAAAVETGNTGADPAADRRRRDHTVPSVVTRATHKQYRHSTAVTDLHEFPDRGHSLTIDAGWPEVAQLSLDWLGRNSL